jgi:hypothetical protein
MLHERKRCRKFCNKISHMNSAVYKEYKNENEKRSDYNLGVGHRYSLHGARLTLAANTISQSKRWWCYENSHAVREASFT